MMIRARPLLGLFILACGVRAAAAEPIDLGSRLELFVDHFLVERMTEASLRLHEPHLAGPVFALDRPWEGSCTGFFTLLHDGDRYRMYYVGCPFTSKNDDADSYPCYAESRDGVSWTRPELGLCEFAGSTKNNILLLPNGHDTYGTNFSPFIDERPGVPATERFKAVGGSKPKGLYILASGDGLHWRKWREQPVFDRGAFDTQNVIFWSASEGCYVLYFRVFAHGAPGSDPISSGSGGYRTIAKTTSPDLVHWSDPQRMSFGDVPLEQLYTNATVPYFRAPHIYLAFPMRFVPGRRFLTDAQFAAREVAPPYADLRNRKGELTIPNEISDGVFMTSRGGYRYDRTFREAFFRPGPDLGNWVSRDGMTCRGLAATSATELSLYHQSHYAQPTACLNRYVLRLDGFGSVNGPATGGEMLTRPLRVSGRQLWLNFATSAAGSLRVEVQEADGEPIPGFSLAESKDLVGDSISAPISWGEGRDLGELAGRTVRLRFVLKDADLYALRFGSADAP